MAQDVASLTWDFREIIPVNAKNTEKIAVKLAASTSYARGQVLGETGTAGVYGKFDSTTAAVPGAPTVTGTSSGSAFAAGTYLVQVTGVNAQGETTPTAPVAVTLTAGQKINVAALSGLDASLTALNVYVDGVLIGSATVSSGVSTATAFDVAAVTTKQGLPSSNTAYTIPNGAGTQKAACVLSRACQTDSSGNITFSPTSGQAGGEFTETHTVVDAFIRGTFMVSDLTGLNAKAVGDLGGHYLMNNTLVLF